MGGTSDAAARSSLETSKRARKLPKSAAALRSGKLSAAKATAIIGAATVNPDAEDELLGGAGLPFGELADKCLRAKAKDADAAHKRIRKERFARMYTDAEGGWNFHARGTIDDGARFKTVFEPIVDEMFNKARAEDRKEPVPAYAFDALIELAERAARSTQPPTPAGPPDPSDRAKEPKRATRPPARFNAMVRIDHAALVRGYIVGEEVCEIAGMGPVPIRVARDLLGDTILKLVLTKGVDVANITHFGRAATAAQRAALAWLSPTCTALGCNRSQRLEIDHNPEWNQTHHTKLDELDHLCEDDHDKKTRLGWALVPGKGKRAFVPPDDPRHPNNCRPPPDDPDG